MNSMATSTYLPALAAPHERTAVGYELAAVLHDLVALSLTGKQLHWVVVGPRAHSLHLQLDELVDTWRSLADAVAERAVTLGYAVDGQAAAVAAGSELTPVAHDAIDDHVLIYEATHRVATVAGRTRARLPRVGAVDLVSQDVLIEVVRSLEKQQWQLRAQFAERA